MHLKKVTQLYVATKSDTFIPQEERNVLTILQDAQQEKSTLYEVTIALLYNCILHSSEFRLIQVKDVRLVNERDYKMIEVFF